MRYVAGLWIACGIVYAQPGPGGPVCGTILSRDGSAAAGEISFRADDNRVFRCAYDGKTDFERESHRIAATDLHEQERIKVVPEHLSRPPGCYVRTLQVLARPAHPLPDKADPLPRWQSPTEDIAPRGALTFAGVVKRISADHILLKIRAGEEKSILLRDDTRFLNGGRVARRSDLGVNTRVFIRSGKTFDGEIEAFQVVWGEILSPN